MAVAVKEQVREMRTLHMEGVSGVELAQHFGVTPANISYIVRRQCDVT